MIARRAKERFDVDGKREKAIDMDESMKQRVAMRKRNGAMDGCQILITTDEEGFRGCIMMTDEHVISKGIYW